MFQDKEKRDCSDVSDTFCLIVDDGENLEMEGDEKFFCKNCLYYKHVNPKNEVVERVVD